MDEGLSAKALLLPRNTDEVSSIMQICTAHNQEVVMFGGLTNLVGSTETSSHEVVISLEKMNRIEEVDTQSRTMTVQAGCILENVQIAAQENELLFPLNFGAKGSAQMGGVISTNAGGLRVLRYGMTRNLVLGLEVVLADGTVINSLKKIIKDNSAYDIKQLFIGAEGTLGIITRAVLKLVERPKSRCSAFVGINDYEQVVALMKYMDAGLAGTLSGYELIWPNTYKAMTTPPASNRPPLPHEYKYYVLIESMGSEQKSDQDRLELLLESALEKDMILDAVIAQSEADISWFWNIREEVSHVKNRCTYEQHFDISLPIPDIGSVIEQTTNQLKEISEVEEVYAFGHVADGNIHFMIGRENDSPDLIEKINQVVYLPLKSLGGSVSAEHGIGEHKKAYLPISRSAAELDLMAVLKQTLDPKGLLNKGKVLDPIS
jgi:FAD/FMN-containing dehydrogenase